MNELKIRVKLFSDTSCLTRVCECQKCYFIEWKRRKKNYISGSLAAVTLTSDRVVLVMPVATLVMKTAAAGQTATDTTFTLRIYRQISESPTHKSFVDEDHFDDD